MNEELFEKLYKLREKIRKKGEDGRTPKVCSDDALYELARLQPESKDELILVSGLGKTFVAKYGDAFMAVIDSMRKEAPKRILSPEVRTTLENLNNRLVNVNKRNRLLYLPRAQKGYAFDMALDNSTDIGLNANKRMEDFVRRFAPNRSLVICDANVSQSELERIKRLKPLLREADRSLREKGDNALYVGYPFVLGRIDGDFPVRAPLVLFPVTVVESDAKISIKMDVNRDVLYNGNLLLSVYKFRGETSRALPSTVVEEINVTEFFKQIHDFYSANGLKLQSLGDKLAPLKEYTASTFPKFNHDGFVIENAMVLGKFPLYSDALQRDFKEILLQGEINVTLNDLLARAEDIDFYSESVDYGNTIVPDYSERNLNYIGDLNISQESAILSINYGDRMVIQGPPGTGKSQVITSMIADAINKGNNVLMVSQKKAALDVIYSRLGDLNRLCLMISDVKDKERFYAQMSNILDVNSASQFDASKFDVISQGIESRLKKLDELASSLYNNEFAGEEIYRIYERDSRSKLDKTNVVLLRAFSENAQKLNKFKTYELSEAVNNVAEQYVIKEIHSYLSLTRKYRYLDKVRSTISVINHSTLLNEADSIIDDYALYKEAKFFARLKKKAIYAKRLRAFIKKNFADFSRQMYKEFFRDPTLMYNHIAEYFNYSTVKTIFDKLNECEKSVATVAYTVSFAVKIPFITSLRYVPEFMDYYFITQFELANSATLSGIANFSYIVKEINTLIDSKKQLSRSRLEYMLKSSVISDIIESKRCGDMKRIVLNKRKWSVPRYVNKFSFELFKGVKLWLMTPEAVSEILPLKDELFDLLIFDEASQIYIEKGVPSIARARKVVVAGDSKQLRPSSLGFGRVGYDDESDELNAALEEESLLDLARFKYPEVLLDYHYRSRYEELIAFSNHAFYKGKLKVSPNVVVPSSPPINVVYVPDGTWQDRANVAEAEQVIKTLYEFITTRKNNATVGVITFNSAQRDLILDLLDDLCAINPSFASTYRAERSRVENGEDVGLFIKNIENVQGDERDCIIFSTAYAKDEHGKFSRNFGWLNQVGGENRLNVAVSRAKEKVIIVTSLTPQDLHVDDLSSEGPAIFKKYLEYAYCISSGDRKGAQVVLESLAKIEPNKNVSSVKIVDSVYEKLHNAGVKVERGVGIGAYKIDLAVKNKKGEYVLGIECDCSLYGTAMSSRERDVHRERFLRSRGWKIYRLWSSNWWRNPNHEIENIIALSKS